MINNENLLRRMFKDWLNIIFENNTMKRCRFAKEKKFKLLSVIFSTLKQYSTTRTTFKSGMKAFIKMRVLNLLRQTYILGLKKNWHRHVINRNFEKAAQFANKARLLQRPFLVLKK